MTRLLLCRSLATRFDTAASVRIVAQHRTVGCLLDWFTNEFARHGGNELPVPRVRLRPLHERDLALIYERWCDPEQGAAWTSRGATPSWQEFPTALWAGVDSAFVGEVVTTAAPVGLVASYGYDGHSLAAFVGVLALDDGDDTALAAECLFALITKLFDDRPLRRVVFEVPDYNAWLLDGVVGPRPLATLAGHRFHRGQWWDVHIVPLDRSEFEELVHLDAVRSSDLLRSPLALER